jgi:hypothetical protein
LCRRDLRNWAVLGAVLRPIFTFLCGSATLQPTFWIVGNRTLKPAAFGNDLIEIRPQNKGGLFWKRLTGSIPSESSIP